MTGSSEVSEGAGDELELSGQFEASISSLRFILLAPRLLDVSRVALTSVGSMEDEVRWVDDRVDCDERFRSDTG